jgi:hypothetical protein
MPIEDGMGQENLNREEMRRKFLKCAEDWSFAPSDWEAGVVEGLSRMEISEVPRAKEGFCSGLNLRENHCHENVEVVRKEFLAIGKMDVESIAGWLIEGPNYVLHSVFRIENLTYCVTPSPKRSMFISFVPDPDIRWDLSKGAMTAFKNEKPIAAGVRRYPHFEIEKNNHITRRLKELDDPYLAIELPLRLQDKLRRLYLN